MTIEALACGTPVIAYDNTAIKELIDNNTGICLKLEDKDKYEKIISFINNKKKVKLELDKISVANMTKKYVELYS